MTDVSTKEFWEGIEYVLTHKVELAERPELIKFAELVQAKLVKRLNKKAKA